MGMSSLVRLKIFVFVFSDMSQAISRLYEVILLPPLPPLTYIAL